MHRSVDLDSRAEQRKATNAHRTHVEYDAVEVEEHPFPQFDIRAVVAEKWGLHPHCIAAGTEQFPQEAPPLVLVCLAGCVEGSTEVSSTFAGSNQFGIQRVVQLPREHFLPLVFHDAFIPSRRDTHLRREGTNTSRSPRGRARIPIGGLNSQAIE